MAAYTIELEKRGDDRAFSHAFSVRKVRSGRRTMSIVQINNS